MKNTPKKEPVTLAVIGGSGLYDIPGMSEVEERRVKTPFGDTSDVIVTGRLAGTRCAFLPRHGRGHRLLPSEVPSRANIYALKSLGVERVIGVGACGSLKEGLAPRRFVIPDQAVDNTRHRAGTFFGNGVVGHVSLDRPFCADLSDALFNAAHEVGVTAHRGGTYVCIEGPAFSTKAESRVNRANGFDVVGMTVAPEYTLAREAELCYATVSLVTDYDVWKDGEEVSVGAVIETLKDNVENVKNLIVAVLPRLAGPRACRCGSALEHAVFTDPKAMKPATRKKLELLIGKYFRTEKSRG
jgi:5'-methylthioadenosine phosphorylase